MEGKYDPKARFNASSILKRVNPVGTTWIQRRHPHFGLLLILKPCSVVVTHGEWWRKRRSGVACIRYHTIGYPSVKDTWVLCIQASSKNKGSSVKGVLVSMPTQLGDGGVSHWLQPRWGLRKVPHAQEVRSGCRHEPVRPRSGAKELSKRRRAVDVHSKSRRGEPRNRVLHILKTRAILLQRKNSRHSEKIYTIVLSKRTRERRGHRHKA